VKKMRIAPLSLALLALALLAGCSCKDSCGAGSGSSKPAPTPAELVAQYSREYRAYLAASIAYEQVNREHDAADADVARLSAAVVEARNAAAESRKSNSAKADELEASAQELFRQLVHAKSKASALFAQRNKAISDSNGLLQKAELTRSQYAPEAYRHYASDAHKELESLYVAAASVAPEQQGELEKRRRAYNEAYIKVLGSEAVSSTAFKAMEQCRKQHDQFSREFEAACSRAANSKLPADMDAAFNAHSRMLSAQKSRDEADQAWTKANENWKNANKAYLKSFHDVLTLPLN
jgi:hypothetical protein